jgi:hypothetical protein
MTQLIEDRILKQRTLSRLRQNSSNAIIAEIELLAQSSRAVCAGKSRQTEDHSAEIAALLFIGEITAVYRRYNGGFLELGNSYLQSR